MTNFKAFQQIYGNQEIPRFQNLNQSTEMLANCRQVNLTTLNKTPGVQLPNYPSLYAGPKPQPTQR